MHRSKSIDEMPVHVYCHLDRLALAIEGFDQCMPGAAARTGLRNT
ncbi:MAG TPA: hypothetical protein VFQ02_10755 [Nitrospira sp.]|nr:hypothetical protein [Nitrospira sp.]